LLSPLTKCSFIFGLFAPDCGVLPAGEKKWLKQDKHPQFLIRLTLFMSYIWWRKLLCLLDCKLTVFWNLGMLDGVCRTGMTLIIFIIFSFHSFIDPIYLSCEEWFEFSGTSGSSRRLILSIMYFAFFFKCAYLFIKNNKNKTFIFFLQVIIITYI